MSKKLKVLSVVLFFAMALSVIIPFAAFSAKPKTAAAATNAKITAVSGGNSTATGFTIFLTTNVPSSASTNLNSNANLNAWRYANVSVNGVQAVNGGVWSNSGYFSTANGYNRYQMYIYIDGSANDKEDFASVSTSPNGYKFIPYKISAGAKISDDYVLSEDYEFTICVNGSTKMFDSVRPTARVTHLSFNLEDSGGYWWRLVTNIPRSVTVNNLNDATGRIERWRGANSTSFVYVNGSPLTTSGLLYYSGTFNTSSGNWTLYNEDGSADDAYYAYTFGITKSATSTIASSSTKRFEIEFKSGRFLGASYFMGYNEKFIFDYSTGAWKSGEVIEGVDVASSAFNNSTMSAEVNLTIPTSYKFGGMTASGNSAVQSALLSAIKVDGHELTASEKANTTFANGKFKISGSINGSFTTGTTHTVTIAKDTVFDAAKSVSGYTNRWIKKYSDKILNENVTFYVYVDGSGNVQATKSSASITPEANGSIGADTNVGSVSYTNGKGWKVSATNSSGDSGNYRFTVKRLPTAAKIAAGYSKLRITFGPTFDGASYTGNPTSAEVWFLLPGTNGTYSWIQGSSRWISGLTSRGDGKYSYTIDLTNASYDFSKYDIKIRVSYNDASAKAVGSVYIYELKYMKDFESSDMTPLSGASIRVRQPNGIGWTTRLSKDVYDDLVEEYGAANVTAGTLILPADTLVGDLTVANLTSRSIAYKDIETIGWLNEATADTDGYYEYRGSLVKVQEQNLTRDFIGRGYVKYNDGSDHYVYADLNTSTQTRNINYVAEQAYNDVIISVPGESTWISATDCTVTYTEGKGWKMHTPTAGDGYFNFYLSKDVISRYVMNGATSFTITAGKSFDGTSHTGAPYNCQAWLIPTTSAGAQNWSYKAGFISGWTGNGDYTYSWTFDLTDSSYSWTGYDLRIRVNCVDVNSKDVSACYVHSIVFNGMPDRDISEYIYPLVSDEYTYTVTDRYTRISAETREIVKQFLLFDTDVFSEGVTGYYVVKPASATATETTAADKLAEYLTEATGVTFTVILDSAVSTFSPSSKYFSVGQTSLLATVGLSTYAEDNVSDDGYIIRTVGSSLFIDGILDRGTLYGVMDFAEKYLGFTFVADDAYTAGAVDSLDIKNIDIKFSPYVATRSYLEYEVCQGYSVPETAVARKSNNYYLANVSAYGGNNAFGYYGGNLAHTMLATLEAGITLDGRGLNRSDYVYQYTAGNTTHYQPCLTNSTVKSLMALAMKAKVQELYSSGIRYYALTQEDATSLTGFCTCSNCIAARNTYGGQSGVTLKFLNDVIDIMDSDASFVAACPDYKIYTFAYQYTINYPTVSNSVIRGGDRVAVMVCPSMQDYRYDAFDYTNNYAAADALNGWHNYSNDLMVWMYDANFYNYVEYHPTLTRVMADNVYKLKRIGISYVMINGAYNGDGNWDDKIRAYVYSKLLYNFDEARYLSNASGYVNDLIDEYLAAYYGSQASAVKSVITALQSAYSGCKIGSNEYVGAKVSSSVFTTPLSTINSAITAAAGNTTLVNRLHGVRAGILASLYECEYKNRTIKSAAIPSGWTYYNDLKTSCTIAGINMWREEETVSHKLGLS